MITLITPTRERPECFRLLETYIARQTYSGPVQWIVVTDGSLEGYKLTQGQTLIIRDPVDDPADYPSICGNYAAALPYVEGDKILFIEDDDYYRPDYLDLAAGLLDRADLCGFAPARYYNLLSRRWRLLGNKDHCSLAQTGMTRAVLDTFKAATTVPNGVFLDMWIWPHWRDTLGGSALIVPSTGEHVGIKSAWGTPGYGTGHNVKMGTLDYGLDVFKLWLGDDWVNYYDR